MRGLVLSLLLSVLLMIGFGVGAASNLPGLMIAGFCLIPFVLVAFGWSLHGVFNGRRLALVDTSAARSPNRNLSDRRQRVSEAPRPEQTL